MVKTKLFWRVKRDKLPGGDSVYSGFLEIPTLTPGKFIKLKATESSPLRAMDSTTSAAMKLLANPMVRDLLPPGADTAIAVATKIVRSKKARKAVKTVTRKAKKFLKSLW